MQPNSEKYPSIVKYTDLWKQGQISKPVVFLVGGYAGTGKSTLVKKIENFFTNSNVLPTGIVRSILRGYISQESNPYLYSHTYDLHSLLDKKSPETQVTELYEKQVEPVSRSINQIIDFTSTEKQHWIIDGNPIFPGFIKNNDEVILFEFYLKVTDPDVHRKLLSGPTHNRKLDETQFHTARKLHDYTVDKATEHNKLIYEYNLAVEEALTFINQTLNKYLSKNYDEQ